MCGKQFGDGVVGLTVHGTLWHVDGQLAVVVVADLDQRALAAAGLDADGNHPEPNVKSMANFRANLDTVFTFGARD
jgi:hypothetical protein